MVPPPLVLQPLLPTVMASMICRPSVWRVIAGVLGHTPRRSMQGACELRVGQHAVTAAVEVELAYSRVAVRLSPEDRARVAAGATIEAVLQRWRRAHGPDPTSWGSVVRRRRLGMACLGTHFAVTAEIAARLNHHRPHTNADVIAFIECLESQYNALRSEGG